MRKLINHSEAVGNTVEHVAIAPHGGAITIEFTNGTMFAIVGHCMRIHTHSDMLSMGIITKEEYEELEAIK